jgi:5-methylcytosine-specific restriction protein A
MMEIIPGRTYSNAEICTIFKCSSQGGMRRSLQTNTLVLISNQTLTNEDNPYHDSWKDSIFYFTGMGLSGDQSLEFMQNRTLGESNTNGVSVYLFEVYQPKQYTYRGRVTLASEPIKSRQKDSEGMERIVWIFPLKLLSDD